MTLTLDNRWFSVSQLRAQFFLSGLTELLYFDRAFSRRFTHNYLPDCVPAVVD
jgi:hypothetical protein